MESPRITLITPDDAEAWSATREILRDYSASLQVDLCFQDFEAELASLPGQYEPPGGLMLLALVDGAVAGCGGFCNLPEVDYPNACEMKRLFVRPAFRRFGLGRMLAQALIDRATQAGYSSMLLDTLDDMEAARGLYESLGFEAVPPYYFNPIPGAHYLRVELA
ncbi:GNAT family N-acetyltransferase [Paucibacter sp. B51]|uniref:GNAT family N-acetyltransferase n=1 Tax=Paucibacter sp. B51 TaxID=2993315 RepID=UPI0022EBFD1A|nr:GNAT family N-acetyltransferase [Paucibacter sp. B51]